MSNRIYERCIYCHADGITYTVGDTYVKCTSCGQTFPVAKFHSEQLRINARLEEGERAKAELEIAVREKQVAQWRLHSAVSSLAGIQDSQEITEQKIEDIISMLNDDEQARAAILELLKGLRTEQSEGQDKLSELMFTLVRSQDTAEEKLNLLQEVSTHILSLQHEGRQITDEVGQMILDLKLDGQETIRLIQQLTIWSQSIREEDLQRLESIRCASEALRCEQEKLADKIDALHQQAQKTMQTVQEFRTLYQADKWNEIWSTYRQATDLQFDREFEAAEQLYRKVLSMGGDDIEVYWRLLMCHYGVEYQKSEDGRYIATILNPDLTDPEELSVRRNFQEHCNKPEYAFYRERLQEIDRILEKYYQLRGEERVQFDVFISVKQSAPEGGDTEDSTIATKLYMGLKEKGLRVFNSRWSLSQMGISGEAYEPFIISALLSAKVLIVVGTRPEYMNSQWVRNEWSRFKWLRNNEMKRYGKTDRALICYLGAGMKAKDIPKALDPSRQAIIDGYDAQAALDKTLSRIFPHIYSSSIGTGSGSSKTAVDPQEKAPVQAKIRPFERLKSVERLLKNGETHFRLGNLSEAESAYAEATKEYPENYGGWWGLILCSTRNLSQASKEQDQVDVWYDHVKKLAPESEFEKLEGLYVDYLKLVAEVDTQNEIARILRLKKSYENSLSNIQSSLRSIEMGEANEIERNYKEALQDFNDKLKSCQIEVERADKKLKSYLKQVPIFNILAAVSGIFIVWLLIDTIATVVKEGFTFWDFLAFILIFILTQIPLWFLAKGSDTKLYRKDLAKKQSELIAVQEKIAQIDEVHAGSLQTLQTKIEAKKRLLADTEREILTCDENLSDADALPLYYHSQRCKKIGINIPLSEGIGYSFESSSPSNHAHWVCKICGWVYDEDEQGTKWEDLPEDFACERCGASKIVFESAE